ncbi:MAG: protease inhibitor I42 family protein [Nitrospirota bacterium]|nr:MAG: protease inhibitor I42 family protein [Nitrospirota bacterium]
MDGNDTTVGNVVSGADSAREVKSIQAKKGATFSVNLWEDRTRGEQWVPSYDQKSFVLMEDEFLRTTSNNAVDSGKRTFEFQALEEGEYRMEFSKRLAWKFTAEDRRVFVITVKK